MDKKGITVRALIEILQTLPQDYPVETEGCDCYGPCSGAQVNNDQHQDYPYVLVTRGSE